MTQPIPTVDDVLARTHLGGHFHKWDADGGVICVTRAELRQALEAAYDPTMPDWPAMVEIDDENNSWPLDGDDYFSGNDIDDENNSWPLDGDDYFSGNDNA